MQEKRIFAGVHDRRLAADVAKLARRRLAMLDAGASLADLRALKGNRLHRVGDVWSISVNMQYRITFTWGENGPEQVWFGDYH
jgi:toxin HigB-1